MQSESKDSGEDSPQVSRPPSSHDSDLRSVSFSDSEHSNAGHRLTNNLGVILGPETNLPPEEEAAILILFARDGHEVDASQLTTRSRLFYRLRKQYNIVFRLAAWGILLVAVFTRPIWTVSLPNTEWSDGSIYPSYQLPYMSPSTSTVLTAMLLAILWCTVMLEFGYKRRNRNHLSKFFACALLVKTLGVIVDAVSLAAGQDPTFSTSPVEAVLVVLVEHRYSSNIGYFMRTIPKFIRLILTLTGFICIYTALGFMIFSPNSQEARKYFGFYGSSVWNMLMVLNGSNWPDPMMPAFDENRAYFVYFFVYIMIAGWGLLNLLQGFIYVFFKEELLIIQERKTFIRHQHLMQAFRLLDSNKVDYLTYAQIDRLLQVMYASFIFSQTLIPPTPEERYELILELDVQKNNVITISDFLLIDEKCFNYALKVLRSKRARFTRFLRAKHGRQSMDSQRDSFVLSNALLEVSASNNKNLAENKPKSIVRKGFIDYFDGWFRDRRSGDEIITLTQDCEDPTYATPSNQNDFQVSRNSTATEGVFERSVSEAAQKYGKIENEGVVQRMLMLEAKNQEGSPSRKAWKHRLAIAIDSIYFDIAMDCWLFFLAIFFLARVRSDEFLICYVLFACLEMLLKLSVKGLFRYYRSYRNSVDGVLSVILVIILIVRASRGYNQAFVGDLGVRGIVVVRILLFPRNIIVTPQFMDWRRRHKTAVEYALRGFTHFSFLLLMMFMMLYGFAALGQQIFGGMICKTGAKGEALSNSLYGQNGYWPLNFNDMPSGMVTMFILLHVNNMHITASGFVAVSNQWAEVFFALWYAIGVLFLLNLLTAVLLNEFASYLQQVSSISKADTANPKSKDGDNTTLNNGKVTDSSSSSSAVLNTVKGGLVRLRNFLALPFITLTQFAPVTAVGRAGIASDRSGQDDTKKGAMFGRMFSWASSAEDQVNVGSPHETNSKGQGSNRRNSILPTYNKSIFADTSDRLHLDDWVSTYYLALKKNENRISLSVGNERESNDVLVLPRLTEVSGSVRNPISRPIDRSSGLGAEQGLNSQNFSQILSVRESLTPLETPFIDDTQRERGLSSPAVPMSPTTAKANSIRSHERAISEEISNRNLNLSHKFQRRQSIFWNLMYAENDMKSYEKAAVLIQFARDGEEHSIASNRRALTCFRIRMKLSNLFRIAAAVLCVLRFFERPLWTFETDGWDDQNTYPMSGIPLLSPYVALAIKLPLLLVLLFGLTLEVIFKENSVVEMLAGANLSAMKVVRYILLLYCFCQLIILLSVAACQCNERLVTVTTIGNLAYLLWFNRRSLYKLKLILRITPQFAAVLFLFFFLCLVFAAIGNVIFNLEDNDANDDYTAQYFSTFSQSIWSVFVAITSSSYPNQIMPSYREYRETVFYFFSFITLGAFGVLNLVLIIVLVQFQRSNQQASDYQTATRQVLLIRAFAVMDYERNGYVDKKDIQLLFTELYTHYSDFRKNRPPQRAAATELLAEILDVDGDGKITVDDFLFFLDVARLKLSTETKKTFLEIHYPSITNSNLFQGLKTLVYSWKFDFGVDTLVAVMIIILFSIKANELYTHNAATETILVLLLLTFMLEATLKIMVKGVKNYFRHMRNQMDFTITVLLLVIFLIAASVGRLFTDSRDVDGLVIAIRVLQVSRLLLYPRNIRYIPSVNRHSKFARILKRIFQKIYTVSIIFFCSGYVFASIGAYAYGGLISPVPGVSPNYDALASSLYGQGDYYQINCNDFLSAVMMLCIAIHVSDFNVLATGFVAVTDKYSRLYFLVWYCVGVLLMLNIVKSFFLGEFLVFFTVSSSNAAAADTADSSGRGEVANGGLTGSRSVSTASGYEGGLGRSSRNNSGVGLSGRIDNIKDTDSRGKTGAGNRARLNLTADEDGIANSKSREATESSITYGTFTRDSPKLPQSWKHAHQPIKRNNSYYNTNSARHSGVGASGLMAGLGIHHRSESETSLDSLALSEMSGIDRSGLDGMVEILDREIFILEIQPHKKRSADNGGSNSLSSMVETPVLNALVENAGSEPIEQSLEQSAGIEPLQIDATGESSVRIRSASNTPLRFYLSTAYIKNLDVQGKILLKSRLQSLALSGSASRVMVDENSAERESGQEDNNPARGNEDDADGEGPIEV